jgi:P-type Cu2+ transporter
MDKATHGRDVDHDHPEDAAVEEATHDHATMDHSTMDHAAMDHAAMDHGDHAAHVDHTGHEDMFRRRFWVSLILSIPVLVYSPMLQQWFGFTAPDIPLAAWIPPVFGSIVFFYGGMPFLHDGRARAAQPQPGMMTLISLAIIGGLRLQPGALLLPESETFFWELVTLIDIMLLGHWLEMRSVRQASRALDELAKLMPDTAERIAGTAARRRCR